MQATKSFEELVAMRNALMLDQKELYVATIANINMRYRELLKNDFGTTLVKNCAWDVADTLASSYFNTDELYVSPQQLYERVVCFSYDDPYDPFIKNEALRKAIYSSQNNKGTLEEIFCINHTAQKKLFEKVPDKNGRMVYVDHKIITDGKNAYEARFRENHGGKKIDDLTGVTEDTHRIERDHIQPLATTTYNKRYVRSDRLVSLKAFFTSDQNLQMLNKSANASKGDTKVYWNQDEKKAVSEKTFVDDRRKYQAERVNKYRAQGLSTEVAQEMARSDVEKYVAENYADITYRATAKQRADAICDQWEKSAKKDNLIASDTLDENGKVPKKVRDNLEQGLRNSMNSESVELLKDTDYVKVAMDAKVYTQKTAKKIIMGQVIYYVLPPLVFETQSLISKKGMTLDYFFIEIKKCGKRITSYVVSKLREIFKNIASNALNKFLKSFFDIIIDIVKETVKKAIKAIKQLVVSLVSCIRTIVSKASVAEKADAVTKTITATVTALALEVLLEWAEVQFNLPDFIMEPLQIIVTIITTNLVMLILQKADLFDVQYGLLVSNIDAVFAEEYEQYKAQFAEMTSSAEEQMQMHYEMLKQQIEEIEQSISSIDLFEGDVTDCLNEINIKYNMGIDFEHEWQTFILGT